MEGVAAAEEEQAPLRADWVMAMVEVPELPPWVMVMVKLPALALERLVKEIPASVTLVRPGSVSARG